MGSKNCPESPRQKMINMMYLVLTAMLALNVAAETLEAFKIVDESLISTYTSFSEKNETLISDFNAANEINPSKVKKWYDAAREIHAKSDSLIKFIVDTKEMLVLGVNGQLKDPTEELDETFPFIITHNNDTLILERQDDLNISPEIMLTKKRGEQLQNLIIEYKNELKELVQGRDREQIIANLESSLDVEDPERGDMKIGDEKFRSWTQKHFTASPVVASITILTKLQIDVCNAESAVLRHLYNQIDASSFKMTGLNATVIPKTNYVFQGQNYNARIFLSAEDSTQDLKVYIDGSNTPLELNERKEAIYSFSPDKIGPATYKGKIVYTNSDGTEVEKFFEEDYEVAMPAVTIAPTKMNVLFKNLKNPISLQAGGIPSDKLKPRFNNGTMYQEDGAWYIEPDELDYNGENTKVSVYADLDGEERFMGDMFFRVMKVPDPVAQVSGISSGSIDRTILRVQNMVSATMENFYFDLKFVVTGFTMTLPTSGGETLMLPSSSYNFTADQKRMLNGLGAGDKILIENIKAKIDGVEDDPERQLSPIVLTVQ